MKNIQNYRVTMYPGTCCQHVNEHRHGRQGVTVNIQQGAPTGAFCDWCRKSLEIPSDDSVRQALIRHEAAITIPPYWGDDDNFPAPGQPLLFQGESFPPFGYD